MRAARFMAAMAACVLLAGCGAQAPAAKEAPAETPAVMAAPEATALPREALVREAVERLSATGLPEELFLLLPEEAAGVAPEGVYGLTGELSREQLVYAVEILFESADFDPASLELSCCLTYESDAILSALLEARDASGAVAFQPLTIERETGRVLLLSDFLSAEDTGWRGLMADMVADAAARGELPLLNEVPPVQDDQLFYLIGEGQIVLLYRPYEITTYQAGFPCFVLPMEPLAGYLTGAYGLGAAAELKETELQDSEMERSEVTEP